MWTTPSPVLGLVRLMVGRACFIIAHRLSTLSNDELILVMRDGDIVEQSKHEELLQRGGFYAKLYNSQDELYLATSHLTNPILGTTQVFM